MERASGIHRPSISIFSVVLTDINFVGNCRETRFWIHDAFSVSINHLLCQKILELVKGLTHFQSVPI
ncbi:MAG: hypothetical protein CM1200mP27_06060 [Chloroflexota bacterium]|nr:MAG: hypothetical protein CM1200mP27_06060 [Chloroflexota bacterium]